MNTQMLDDLLAKEKQIQILAEALRDLYNDVGEIPEVKDTFEKVYYIVKEYA